MKFIFDCADEVCLPAAWRFVDSCKEYIDKIKDVDIEESDVKDRISLMKLFIENAMCKYPKETGQLLAKLWILEEEEEAPNIFKTTAALFKSEVAIDFFTSALPSLLQISKVIFPALK